MAAPVSFSRWFSVQLLSIFEGTPGQETSTETALRAVTLSCL